MNSGRIKISERLPEKGANVVGYDKEGDEYHLFRCACPNEKCREWRDMSTGHNVMVDIVEWVYVSERYFTVEYNGTTYRFDRHQAERFERFLQGLRKQFDL